MKVVVLGAGVVGVASAYYLAQAGHDVVVIDRREGVGLETSFANGGQIAAAHASPWAQPSIPMNMLRWSGRADAPLYVGLKTDPDFWRWGLKFLRNCTAARFKVNAERIRRLTSYSFQCLKDLRDEHAIEYERNPPGVLSLFRSSEAFETAAFHADDFASESPRVLDREGCVEFEPALVHAGADIVGGLFWAGDESGDALLFTERLAEICRTLGVEFRLQATVSDFELSGPRITGVHTDGGLINGDAFVLALGSYSPLLARRLGLRLPVYPIKGYSVTVAIDDPSAAPDISLADDEKKIVLCRLGNRLRAAGTAEVAGYDLTLSEARCKNVARSARDFLPKAGDHDKAEFWTGLRPMTPDGPPLLGRAGKENLFLNTGHGTLGWTMACASGRLTADVISGREPGIDMDGLTLERY